jgi:hypothetical protein
MKQAWNDVADGFTELGKLVKARYQSAGTDEAAGEGPSAGAALREAFDRLVAAGRELGDRATDVARDDVVKAQAKRAASSLNDALSATVDLIGDEVGGLFKRAKSDEAPAIVTPQATNDDSAS